MSTTLFRSLIAGSFSAVATLTFVGVGAAHAETPAECGPIHIDNGDGTGTVVWVDFCEPEEPTPTFPTIPFDLTGIDWGDLDFDLPIVPPGEEECDYLTPDQIDVRASQTSPYDWQWRVFFHGDVSDLCDRTVSAEMQAGGGIQAHSVSVLDVVAANAGGEDYVIEFATGCEYTTFLDIEGYEHPWDAYEDIERGTPDCLGLVEELPGGVDPGIDPDIPGVPGVDIPDLPETPDTPDTPDTPEVPGSDTPDTPETPDTPDTPTPGDRGLPTTGSDTTVVVIGAALLLLGAGLGLTALGMSRRRSA